jgi:hypothetical protein
MHWHSCSVQDRPQLPEHRLTFPIGVIVFQPS